MNWDEGSEDRKNNLARAGQRQMPGAQVMPASEPAPDLQDYRIHMLLSTLMLVAGLLFANLQ